MTVLLPILMYRSIHKFDIEFARVQIVPGYFVVRPYYVNVERRRSFCSRFRYSFPPHMPAFVMQLIDAPGGSRNCKNRATRAAVTLAAINSRLGLLFARL